jgi:TetR/AcrR family transcriptional regulator, repressor for uid operon
MQDFDRFARSFFEMLNDPEERERRKVTIQVWAESLRDKRIRKIVERGIQQRDLLTAALSKAQRAGQLRADLDPDAMSRVLLALLQGFILQQAWEPKLDTEAFLTTALDLIHSTFKNT